jgi:hypothetical protein
MKYKSSELELPPLGENIAVKMHGFFQVGSFYINEEGRRAFNTERLIKSYEENDEEKLLLKWSYLPKFKSIKEEKPPVGVLILVAFRDDCLEEGFYNYFYLKHFSKGQFKIDVYDNSNKKEIEIDAWLPLDTFDDDEGQYTQTGINEIKDQSVY